MKPTFATARNEPSLVVLDWISDALARPCPFGSVIASKRYAIPIRKAPAADRRPANLVSLRIDAPELLYLLARLETRFGPQKTNLIGTECGMHWLEDKALWPLKPMGPRLPRRCPPHRTHYEKGAPYKTIGVEFGRSEERRVGKECA